MHFLLLILSVLGYDIDIVGVVDYFFWIFMLSVIFRIVHFTVVIVPKFFN